MLFDPKKKKQLDWAKLCTVDQTQINVDCARGTIGYIAPEQFYKNLREFSVKCDVYSFGVLLMEIISGKMNNFFYQIEDEEEHMLSYAWRLWKEGEPLEFVDPTIRESCNPNEVMRCIHVALLCVQEHPADRPSMSSIVIMLHTYSLTLPSPSDPLNFRSVVYSDVS
ncbi:hypothetical protein K1719_005021 [Acacia pycnantha]|nr:hypothetical protein K1719_005021 [Acacia pycnantha]